MTLTIQHFTDIGTLYACWHASLSTTDVTGSVVNHVTPAYSGLPLDANLVAQKQATGEDILFSGNVGSMPCWDTQAVVNQRNALVVDSFTKNFTNGMTVVSAFQLHAAADGYATYNAYSINEPAIFTPMVNGSAGTAPGDRKWRVRTGWGDSNSVIGVAFTPTVHVYTQPATGGPSLRVWDDVNSGAEHQPANPPSMPANITAMACAGGLKPDQSEPDTYGMNGKVSIFAVYDGVLSPADTEQAVLLCQHWITNNNVPSAPTYPESETFGPVTINDPTNATLQWQWRAPESSDPADWTPALAALSNASLVAGHPAGTTELSIN